MEATERKYKEIQDEIVQAEKNLRNSGYKTWAILFVSSFLIYLWTDSIAKFINANTIILIPVFLNSITWLFWFLVNYITFLRPSKIFHPLDEKYREYANYDSDFKYMYRRWEHLIYRLQRQLRYIRIIELFVSLQIALIPLLWGMSIIMY